MKNKVLLIVVLYVFITAGLSAQSFPFKRVEFPGYNPKWFSYVEDSTAIGLEQPFGYDYVSQFTYVNSVLRDSFLYCLYFSRLQNNRIDGTYVEKINVNTGRKVWSNIFDLRKSDYAEKPKLMFFNDNDDLVVIGARLISKKEDKKYIKSTLFKRVFNSETGELLDFSYASKEDTTSHIFKQYFDMFRYGKDKYQYLLNEYWGKYKDDIHSIVLDEKGKFIKENNHIYTNIYKYTDRNRPFYLLNDSTFISTRKIYEDHELNQLVYNYSYYIEKYGRDLDSLSVIDLSDVVKAKGDFNLVLEYFDKELLMFYFKNESFFNVFDYYYLIFDHSGNLLDSININRDKDFHLGTIKRISDDEILIVGTNTVEVKKDFSLRIYRKKFGKPLIFVREIEIKPKDVYLNIRKVEMLKNGDFIFYGLERLFFDNIFGEKWPFWMYISGEDLEHGVNVESLGDGAKDAHLMLYPNPAKDKLEIRFGTATIKHIKVFDLQGKLVLEKEFDNSSSKYIDISQLNKGVYFVNAFVGDKVIAHGKFVKE